MGNKPGIICQLQKGKFIGAHKGFCDTWNWLANFVANLTGKKSETDPYIEIEGENTDHPKLVIKNGGAQLKRGDYTNIVFTKDDEDGKTKVDVYYL